MIAIDFDSRALARWAKSEFSDAGRGLMRTIFPSSEDEWKRRAADYIKQILDVSGVSYETLARELKPFGFEESRASVTLKLKRGSFSAAWFLACIALIGVDKISIKNEFNTSRVRHKIPHHQHRTFIHKPDKAKSGRRDDE